MLPSHLHFDRVYVINLERDVERMTRFQRELPQDWPWPKPERIPAVDGQLVPSPDWWEAGSAAWGCFQSHLRILQRALEQKTESLLIFEDDAVFVDSFTTKLQGFARELPKDWEFIYLGGQHIQREQRLPVKLSSHVYRPHNVHRAHAYGLRGKRVMQTIYKHLHSVNDWGTGKHYDHRLGELHQDYPGGVYVPDTWLVGQGEGFSNIKGKHLEANFFPDTRWLFEAPIDLPMVAVVGNDGPTRLWVAAVLHHLGVPMGEASASLNRNRGRASFAAPGLEQTCDILYCPIWLIEKTNAQHRQAHLRMWASRRAALKKHQRSQLGGTHPTFCIMARELSDAWDQPTVVIVESPPTDSPKELDVCGAALLRQNRFAQGMREFKDSDFKKVIRIRHQEWSAPDQLIGRLAEELRLPGDLADWSELRKLTTNVQCFSAVA